METKIKTATRGRAQIGSYKKDLEAETTNIAMTIKGYVVYGLASNKTPHKVEYVGYTCMDLNRRYANHIYESKKQKTEKDKWISRLREKEEKLIMIILHDNIHTLEDACNYEEEYIQQYRNEGADLKNCAAGGQGTKGYKHTAETIAKQSKAASGKKQSPEHIKRRQETKRKNEAKNLNMAAS